MGFILFVYTMHRCCIAANRAHHLTRSHQTCYLARAEAGAHHYDLRASHALDPPSVIAVRAEEKVAITKWVAEWASDHA